MIKDQIVLPPILAWTFNGDKSISDPESVVKGNFFYIGSEERV